MQLQINFTGKKDNSISFRATDDLKSLLESLTKKLGRDSLSQLAEEYVIECATRDMGKLLLLESRKDKHFVNMTSL